jgi:hypothetical protein
VLRGVAICLLVLVVASSPWWGERPAAEARATAPAGLPAFGIGLAAHPDNTGIYDWMPSSGVPWSYAYQYLVGGVNTNVGWETWNASGQFPLYYANGANARGYIPVFPYYEILQSTTTCSNCGEAQRDLANLNDTALMASYYQNFILLMQRLGPGTYDNIPGYGKTAIVHVEPDLSGYAMQAVLNNAACSGYCTGQGNNPGLLKAAVQSTGVAQVAGYANTYQGFNWALLHLRDLYAPNVLLAFHVSDWATATDVGTDTRLSLDAAGLGQQAGLFAAQSGATSVPAGVSPYNLLFNDVADRDAGHYKYGLNNPCCWWDRLNVTFPNFHRWEAYIGAASQAAGRPVIVWQIPEGNQYFQTVNNTDGHYQDNRAEYFFAHVAELQQAGIIGLLFGAGNGGSTVHTDGKGDGITNPASLCTSDGLSSGTICNNHPSVYPDDDGGYIRLQAAAFYAGGGGTPTATPTRTATPSPGPTRTPTVAVTPVPRGRRVHTTTAPTGDGHLQVTVSVVPADCALSNQLTALRFADPRASVNERVDLPALAGLTVQPPLPGAQQLTGRHEAFTVSLPPGTTQLTFTVGRATAGQPTTVNFTVVDGCGDWPTFVGGGSAAW